MKEFIGVVTSIRDTCQSHNYSFVLERRITLNDGKSEVDFLISRFTKMTQGSFFEVGDQLKVFYDEDTYYPCYEVALYEAKEVFVAP